MQILVTAELLHLNRHHTWETKRGPEHFPEGNCISFLHGWTGVTFAIYCADTPPLAWPDIPSLLLRPISATDKQAFNTLPIDQKVPLVAEWRRGDAGRTLKLI